MKKLLKAAAVLGVAFVVLLVAAALALVHLIQVGEFRRLLVSELEKRTSLKVNLGSAEVSLGKVAGVSLRDFALLEPESGQPVITSERVFVRFALLPLLERKLDFYEIRFQRPTLKLTRDERGEVPLLELLLPPLSPAESEGPFRLDLRRIRIDGGEMVFLDQREGVTRSPLRLRAIYLTLSRVSRRGVASRETPPAAPAVEFGLRGTLDRAGSQAEIESRGKVVFPPGPMGLTGASVEAETRIDAVPVGILADYAGALLPVEAAGGTARSRLRWRGTWGEHFQVKGMVAFKGLRVDAPQIFAAAVAPGNSWLDLELEWRPREIQLLRLEWRSEEISAALRGTVRRPGDDDPEIDLRFATPFLPVVKARKYFPLAALDSLAARPWIDAVEQGEVSVIGAGVAGPLSEIGRLSNPRAIWFQAELQDVAGRFPGEGELSWRGVSGRVALDRGALQFKRVKGTFGDSRVGELNGVVRGWIDGAGVLELRARGELELAEVRDWLRSGPAARAMAQLKQLRGPARFDASVRKTPSSSYQLDGRLALEGAHLAVADFSFGQVRGEIGISPKEIRWDGVRGEIAGSPLRVSGSVGLSEASPFDLQFHSAGVKAGVVTKLLLGAGSLEDPGTVRGAVRYQGSLAGTGESRLSGSLELSGVQFPMLHRSLRDVGGRLRFDGAGIDFQDLRGRLAGSPVEFRGRWRHGAPPQLSFELSAAEMDLGSLLAQVDDAAGEWYDRLEANGRVRVEKGRYENFEFSNLETDLSLAKRAWRLSAFSARSSGGSVEGSGSFVDGPAEARFAVESKIRGVPVRGFLRWFDMKTAEITGRVALMGQLDSSGKTGAERKRNLNGEFHLEIEDGVIRRLRVLVRILNLLDLSRWFTLQMPDINQEGIQFRRITGDFKVSRGVYVTQNLLVDSDDLRLTGAGKVDGAEGEIDFLVAVRPFPRVTSVVRSIPLIGRGLAAIKDSFLVGSFRVTGSLENPIVVPAPLSTLSEFFFGALQIPKSLMGIPSEESQ